MLELYSTALYCTVLTVLGTYDFNLKGENYTNFGPGLDLASLSLAAVVMLFCMVVYLRYAGVYGYRRKYCREGLRNFHSLEEEGKGTFANRRRDRRKASHLISTATNSTKFDNLAIV